MTGGTDGREGAEDGETDGADEADVDEVAVTKTGGAIVHVVGRGKREFLAESRTRQEHPHQILPKGVGKDSKRWVT